MKFAVVPACGRSTRMGRSKLTLPLGDGSVIERIINTLIVAGTDSVLVVTGPHDRDIAPLAAKAGALVVDLPQPTENMRATVEAGLAFVQDRFHPASDDPWLLAPADFPAFSSLTVSQLFQAMERQPAFDIAPPLDQGQRGHPILLRWQTVEWIRNLPPHLGINAFVRQHSHTVLEVPVTDPGIHLNLNTPEDYAAIQQHLQGSLCPNIREP